MSGPARMLAAVGLLGSVAGAQLADAERLAAPRPLPADAVTEDWPGFLGPRRDATSRETRLRADLPAALPLVWSLARGQGVAGPAIVGERLVHTHRVGDEAVVECLDPETGARRWRVTWPTDYRGRYYRDHGPRATPAIAAGRVYVHGVEGRLVALDLESGERVWERDVKADFGVRDDFFGVVSSPLVHGDLLIQMLGAPGGPCVAAFRLDTGELVWSTGDEWGPSCSSPVVATLGGRERLFVLAGGESRPPRGGLLILDPATGALAHRYPFRSRRELSVAGATPAVGAGCVVVTDGYGTGMAAVEHVAGEESGEPEAFRERWRTRSLGLEFTNPLFLDGRLWCVDGVSGRTGALTCLDPADGRELARLELDWTETVVSGGKEKEVSLGVGQGSLLAVDGRLLCLGDDGALLWLVPDPDGPAVLARTRLFHALETWTPPVVRRGLLYVLQNETERFGAEPRPPRLLCFDLRAAAP